MARDPVTISQQEMSGTPAAGGNDDIPGQEGSCQNGKSTSTCPIHRFRNPENGEEAITPANQRFFHTAISSGSQRKSVISGTSGPPSTFRGVRVPACCASVQPDQKSLPKEYRTSAVEVIAIVSLCLAPYAAEFNRN
jgi:hypothetical protein